MERLGFEIDWLDGNGIQGLELAATYARVQIHVGDEILTQAADREAHAVRDYLLRPALPTRRVARLELVDSEDTNRRARRREAARASASATP